jgi:hypothetical protein
VTAVPSLICGVLFLRALVKEYRPSKTVRLMAALQFPYCSVSGRNDVTPLVTGSGDLAH